MAADVFGEYLDIHTGGIDHLTVHHENEIAQSDSCFGHKCVSNWMHCEFLQVDGGKMSKSLNNIYTIAQLEEKGFDALDFKYFCLTTHYRKAINFTFDALTAAKNARESLMMQIKLHKNSNAKTDEQLLEKIKQNFKNAVEDDLNMPLALASVFEAIKLPYSIDVYNLVQKLDVALGLKLNAEEQVPAEIELLAKQRWQAKKDRNFAQADALRTEVLSKGYEILDSKDGYQIIKK